MRPNEPLFTIQRIVVLIAAIVVLLISVSVYVSRSNAYAPVTYTAASYQPPVTNAAVLLNWLPTNVYTYTIARVDDYLRAKGTAATSLTVSGDVQTSDVLTYNFTLIALPSGQKITVGASVTNEGGKLATAVLVNQQLQAPQVPSASGSIQYVGVDSLVSAGLSATQANELQQALEKFAPSASTFTITTNTINSGDLSADGLTRPYTFSIAIDGKNYTATLNAIGLSQAELLLKDASGHQVFDSGVLSQGS